MKNKIIAAALIKSVIEYKIALLTECAEKILSGAEFLNRTNFSYKEATDTVGDLVLYGLKAR